MNYYFERCLNGQPLETNEEKKYEFSRLITFKDWPKDSPLYPLRLAQAGFYFSGSTDEVVCPWCGLRKEAWQSGEEPWKIHQTLSPACAFFTTGENIPLSPIEEQIVQTDLSPSIKAQGLDNPGATKTAVPAVPSNITKSPANVSKRSVKDKAKSTSKPSESAHVLRGGQEATNIAPHPEIPRADTASGGQFDSLPSSMSSGRDLDIGPSLGPGVESLRYERKRLETFKGWPRPANVPEAELARCGFYYTGAGDRVQCIFCKGILRNWEPGDRPHVEHRLHFPKCPLVLGLQVGNVPLPLEAQSPPSRADGERQPAPALRLNVQTPNNMASLGIMTEKPKHPQFAVLSQRLASFKGWPASRHQTPPMLAEAGFWYAGFSDNVKCFFCDGGLRNWETGDEPWSEHAKWFPRCPFIKQVKGEEFIHMVQKKQSADTPILEQAQKLKKSANRPESLRAGTGSGVEEREIRARMDRDYVRVVESMGISRDQIKKALRKQLTEEGDDFPSTQALLEAVFKLQEEAKNQINETVENNEQESLSVEEPQSENLPPNGVAQMDQEIPSSQPTTKPPGTDASPVNAGSLNASASSIESPEEILRENLELKEQRLCKICMVGDANVVFLPCGHLVSCAACSPALTQCPICRAEIRGTIRTYLA